MKKLFIALSLCACLTACGDGAPEEPKTIFVAPNEKIIGYTVNHHTGRTGDLTYMTIPMFEDDIAECYTLRETYDEKFQMRICERKE